MTEEQSYKIPETKMNELKDLARKAISPKLVFRNDLESMKTEALTICMAASTELLEKLETYTELPF